jgi:hypothetical protein
MKSVKEGNAMAAAAAAGMQLAGASGSTATNVMAADVNV